MSHARFVVALIAVSIITPASAVAEPLGRLFFTPSERNALDGGKHLRAPRSSQVPAVRGPREVKLDGVVTRSDGETTVWINGRTVSRTGTSAVNASASASDPAAARVELPGARTPVKLKVGQRFDRSTGKLDETYEAAPMDTKQLAPEPAQRNSQNSAQERLDRGNPAGTSDRAVVRPSND